MQLVKVASVQRTLGYVQVIEGQGSQHPIMQTKFHALCKNKYIIAFHSKHTIIQSDYLQDYSLFTISVLVFCK